MSLSSMKKKNLGSVPHHMDPLQQWTPVFQALGKNNHKDQKPKVMLPYTVSVSAACAQKEVRDDRLHSVYEASEESGIFIIFWL